MCIPCAAPSGTLSGGMADGLGKLEQYHRCLSYVLEMEFWRHRNGVIRDMSWTDNEVLDGQLSSATPVAVCPSLHPCAWRPGWDF